MNESVSKPSVSEDLIQYSGIDISKESYKKLWKILLQDLESKISSIPITEYSSFVIRSADELLNDVNDNEKLFKDLYKLLDDLVRSAEDIPNAKEIIDVAKVSKNQIYFYFIVFYFLLKKKLYLLNSSFPDFFSFDFFQTTKLDWKSYKETMYSVLKVFKEFLKSLDKFHLERLHSVKNDSLFENPVYFSSSFLSFVCLFFFFCEFLT